MLAFLTTLADAALFIGPARRLFLNVGFLGAYTTFSSLALGDILLFTNNQWLAAFLYLALSLIGGLLAALLGILLGQFLIKRILQKWQPSLTLKTVVPILQGKHTGEHVDVDDDLIYPEKEDQRV